MKRKRSADRKNISGTHFQMLSRRIAIQNSWKVEARLIAFELVGNSVENCRGQDPTAGEETLRLKLGCARK